MTAGTTLDDSSAPHSSVALTRTRIRWYTALGLVGALLGGALAYAAAPLLPASYTAESLVVVRSPNEVTVFGGGVGVSVSTASLSAAQMLRSQDVAIGAADLLGNGLTPAQVAAQTTVTTDPNSPVVTVQATAASAELARDLADAVPQAYLAAESAGYADRARERTAALEGLRDDQQQRLEAVQAQMEAKTAQLRATAPPMRNLGEQANYVSAILETDITYQRLQNEAATLTSSISATENSIQQNEVDFAILESGVDRFIEAQLPSQPAGLSRLEYIAVGLVLGALAGAALAFYASERRRALDAGLAAATLGAPLLGRFGPDRRLRRFPRFVDLTSDAESANELKVLASSLLINVRRRSIGSVVVTSARAREGKTVLAANIAAAADFTGHAVALVDAAVGTFTVSDALGLDEATGLSEVLRGGPLADSLHMHAYGADRTLPVVPRGLDGWGSETGRQLSEPRRTAWAAAFDGTGMMTAIVDAPAVNDHPLPLQLAAAGVLVVISPRTTLADLEVLRNRAEVAEVTVLGFVINEVRAGRRRHRPRRRAVRQVDQGNFAHDAAGRPLVDARADA